MRLGLHTLSSLTLGAWIGFYFQSFSAFVTATLAGILVDLDHIFDYIYYWCSRGREIKLKRPHTKFRIKGFFSISNFFKAFYNGKTRRIFVFFHAYEWLVIMIVMLYTWHSDNLNGYAFLAGYILHLTCDTLYNSLGIPGYFLSYRIWHRFKRETLCNRIPYLKKTFLKKYMYKN